MDKMNSVFEKFAIDKNLLDEFLKKATLDEMYDFCVSIDEKITREEFDNYISEAIDSYEAYIDKSVSESDLGKITGGTAKPDKELMKYIYKVYRGDKKEIVQTEQSPVNMMSLDSNTSMQVMPDGTMQSLK